MNDFLLELFKECMNEVKALSIEPGEIVSVNISKQRKSWGLCTKRSEGFYISINEKLFSAHVEERKVKEVIIHEILHTCEDSFKHTGNWKRFAELINNFYGYNITRGSSNEYMGIIDSPELHRYALKCEKCGKLFFFDRMGKYVKDPSSGRCGSCKGELIRIK